MSTTGIAELLNISRQMVHKHQLEISRGNTSNWHRHWRYINCLI